MTYATSFLTTCRLDFSKDFSILFFFSVPKGRITVKRATSTSRRDRRWRRRHATLTPPPPNCSSSSNPRRHPSRRSPSARCRSRGRISVTPRERRSTRGAIASIERPAFRCCIPNMRRWGRPPGSGRVCRAVGPPSCIWTACLRGGNSPSRRYGCTSSTRITCSP